jgi:hypothetical protein
LRDAYGVFAGIRDGDILRGLLSYTYFAKTNALRIQLQRACLRAPSGAAQQASATIQDELENQETGAKPEAAANASLFGAEFASNLPDPFRTGGSHGSTLHFDSCERMSSSTCFPTGVRNKFGTAANLSQSHLAPCPQGHSQACSGLSPRAPEVCLSRKCPINNCKFNRLQS